MSNGANDGSAVNSNLHHQSSNGNNPAPTTQATKTTSSSDAVQTTGGALTGIIDGSLFASPSASNQPAQGKPQPQIQTAVLTSPPPLQQQQQQTQSSRPATLNQQTSPSSAIGGVNPTQIDQFAKAFNAVASEGERIIEVSPNGRYAKVRCCIVALLY
jgi:hypothetical protein